ncbi:MAG: DNA translocase FtsK 4TM domain-containing protein [Candidatus Brocadiia bacterium]
MDRKRLAKVTAGIVLLALGAFLVASLVTHDPTQGPFPDVAETAGGGNACGLAGAYVSAYALALLGWAAYPVTAFVAGAGVLLITGRPISDWPFRAVGFGLVVLGLVLGLALFNASADSGAGRYSPAAGRAGGVLGILLAGVLYRSVGATGTLILFLMFSSLGFFLVAGAELAHLTGTVVDTLGGWLGSLRIPAGGSAARPEPAKASAGAQTGGAVGQATRAVSDEEQSEEDEEETREVVLPDADEEPAEPPSMEPELVSSFVPASVDDEEEEFDLPDKAVPEGEYDLPAVNLLSEVDNSMSGENEADIREKGQILQRTLSEFNVSAKVVRIQRGPVITMYELSLAPGTKVSKVESLADDLAIALKAPNVRIVAPLPGKDTVGIEVPNSQRELVCLRELMEATRKKHNSFEIPLFLGKDTAGNPLVLDLASCPHLLVAGATGSGKSVAINAMIASILMTRTPHEVQLLLIDPKSVEFSDYGQLPHLACPVLTDMKKAASVLKWACKKMDERYSVLSAAGVRDLTRYNELSDDEIKRRLDPEEDAVLDDVPFYMPHIVIIVDEFGELMMVAAKEVENSVTRLSQKARAVGIHLICATQRPSVDVITGLIKANLPARIAFQVSSKVDSRTILDRNGAELLLGKGDMLLLPPGTSRLVRAQGTYVTDGEVTKIVNFLEGEGDPRFRTELRDFHAKQEATEHSDDLYDEAVRIVVESQRGSVSLLQRRLSIGYSRAARLVDMMAEAGIVGEHRGSKARRVLMSREEWEQAHAET